MHLLPQGSIAMESKPPRSKLRGIPSRMIVLGAASPKPPLAIPPPSKLGGILANLVKENPLRETAFQLLRPQSGLPQPLPWIFTTEIHSFLLG